MASARTIMTLTAQVDALPSTAPLKRFLIKGVTLASHFSPIPRNAIPHISLPLGPFYPRQPDSAYHQSFIRAELMQ